MSCRMSNLTEGGVSDIKAVDVEGLVNVVPPNGPGDKANDYCINGFAIDNYSALLAERQRSYPKWCRHSLFVKTTELIRVTQFTFCVFIFCGLLCLQCSYNHCLRVCICGRLGRNWPPLGTCFRPHCLSICQRLSPR